MSRVFGRGRGVGVVGSSGGEGAEAEIWSAAREGGELGRAVGGWWACEVMSAKAVGRRAR